MVGHVKCTGRTLGGTQTGAEETAQEQHWHTCLRKQQQHPACCERRNQETVHRYRDSNGAHRTAALGLTVTAM